MRPLIIGHRGASAYEPENTISSFRKAIEMGADAIEFDLRKTKDNKIVVFHDKVVDRVTNGVGLIKNLTIKELKGLSVLGKEKIPTFEEVLKAVDSKAILFLEFKETGFESEVLKLLKKYKVKRFILTSFDKDILVKLRKLDKKVALGLITITSIGVHKFIKLYKINVVVQLYKTLTKTFLERMHRNKIKVYAWTVNGKRSAKILVKLGVDGIASNKPDMLKKIV